MGLGVWLHVTERHEQEHQHEAMERDHAHVHDEHHQHEHAPDDPPVSDPKPHRDRHGHARMVQHIGTILISTIGTGTTSPCLPI